MNPAQIDEFEIRERLGGGGMGIVYLGYDPGLDRLVAVKVLREEFRSDPELRARFLREARAVASMKHSTNVVVIHATGTDPTHGPFMAMEYIAGHTLKTLLSASDVPSLLRRLELMEELCNGLAHAHRHNIIHRDIKPANLIVDSDGVLKILDFGIARVDGSNTISGVVGTFSYMSPEQASGTQIDKRSDVFAVGSVLYETIALRQAFPGEGFAPFNRIREVDYVRIEEVVDGIDPELADIVYRALQLNPADRHQSMEDMRRAVRRCRERLARQAGTAGTSFETVVRRPNRDEEDTDAIRERNEMVRRVKEQRRRNMESDVKAAQEALTLGNFDTAREFAERALMIDPDDRTALETLDRVRYAQDAARVRLRITEARDHAARGDLDEAVRIAQTAWDAAQALSDAGTAANVRAEVRACIEELRTSRERGRTIATSLERARTAIANQGFDTALRAVYEVLALDPDQSEARELERVAQQHVQQQREASQRRRDQIARIDEAVAAAKSSRFTEAEAALAALLASDDADVRAAAADANATVVGLRRRASHSQIIDSARRAFQRGALEEASAAIASIPADALTGDWRELSASITAALEQQRESERRRQGTDDLVAVLRKLLDSGGYAEALQRLQSSRDIDLDDVRIVNLRKRLDQQRGAAEARKRREERDRLAATHVESARKRAGRGEIDAAITQLETFDAQHPLISAALDELRSERAAARAHRQAEERIAGLVQAARMRAASGDVGGALALLKREDLRHPVVAAVLAELKSAKATADVTHALSSAADALSLADYDAAERFVNDALRIQPRHPEAQALRASIADVRATSARTKEDENRRRSQPPEPQRVRPRPPSRARIAAAVGSGLAIVFAVLLVIWWRGASSPEQMARTDNEPEMQKAEPPKGSSTGAKDPDAAPVRESPVTPPPIEGERDASGNGSNKQREDERITVLVQQAKTRAAAGDDDAAVKLLEREGQRHPLVKATIANIKAVKAAVARAGQALALADYDTAAQSVDQALVIEPNHQEALRLKGRVVDERAKSAKAEAAKVEAARLEAAKVEAAKVEAAKAEAAKIEAARIEAARVEAAKTESVKAALSRADNALKVPDYDAAEKAVDEALAIRPNSPEALATRIRIADERAKLDINTARKIVGEFVAVVRRRDPGEFSKLVPGASGPQKDWMKQLQRDYKTCQAELTGVSILKNGPKEARVEASGKGLCEPNVGRDKVNLPTTYVFTFIKNAGGSWGIDRYQDD